MKCHEVVGVFCLVLGRGFRIISQLNAECGWIGSLAVAR